MVRISSGVIKIMFHVTKVANSYHGGILVTISVKILAQHRVTKMLGEVPAEKVKCKLRSRTLIETTEK